MLALYLVAGSAAIAAGVGLFRYVAGLWAQLPACNEDFIVEMTEAPKDVPPPPRHTPRVSGQAPAST